jgi:hypothetical protein
MKRITTFALAFTLALLVSACNFPFVSDSGDVMATSVAETVEALEARMVKPTLAPLPTQAPVQPETPADKEFDPKDWEDKDLEDFCNDEYCDEDYYYDDDDLLPEDQCLYATVTGETISDGTNFSTGESFTKSWTFRNDGYCDWNEDYAIDFKSGNQMGWTEAADIGTEIDPGESITLSLDLTAPSTAGTYTGYWQLKTDDGVGFGKVWVTIDVE